ncbi:hypothetical protein CBM2600_A120441 [Cupriavidus taiwanensis]|nr:hypothetical protein CBM2600_A120441 [Cupriavidus taiwanensis]
MSEHPCNRAFSPARSCERTAAAGAGHRDDTELANHRVHLPACSAKHTASPAVSDQVFAQAIRARMATPLTPPIDPVMQGASRRSMRALPPTASGAIGRIGARCRDWATLRANRTDFLKT